jgi:hypothetical protein
MSGDEISSLKTQLNSWIHSDGHNTILGLSEQTEVIKSIKA